MEGHVEHLEGNMCGFCMHLHGFATIFFSISLEVKLVKTLLSILGVVYLFTPWIFCMVETLINPYLSILFLLEVSHLLFCGLTV
jgi:hypothetical protein